MASSLLQVQPRLCRRGSHPHSSAWDKHSARGRKGCGGPTAGPVVSRDTEAQRRCHLLKAEPGPPPATRTSHLSRLCRGSRGSCAAPHCAHRGGSVFQSWLPGARPSVPRTCGTRLPLLRADIPMPPSSHLNMVHSQGDNKLCDIPDIVPFIQQQPKKMEGLL